MAGITTHVLDTDRGCPAAGVRIDLSVMEGGTWRLMTSVTTNADGRTDELILPADEARTGEFQLKFFVADYLKGRSGTAEADIFIDDPVVRFGVFDARQHYHVPMLCAPASISTSRGS